MMQNEFDINDLRRKVQTLEDNMLRCKDKTRQMFMWEDLQKKRSTLWKMERRLRAYV